MIHYNYNLVEWNDAAGDIMGIREKVFIIEQRFGVNKLSDSQDENSFHILVTDPFGQPVACGRLRPDGRMGYIAVLVDHRSRGIGTHISDLLVSIALQNNIHNLSINADTELSPFYDKQHFHADGPVYMNHGIPFRKMSKYIP